MGDVRVLTAQGVYWLVTGANGENVIEARGSTQAEAWHRAWGQAECLGMLRRGKPRGLTAFNLIDMIPWTVMTLRKRWAALPTDIKFAYAAAAIMVPWFVLRVAAGPDLLAELSWCLVCPLLVILTLVILYRFAFCTPRRVRVLPLILVSGCLAMTFVTRDIIVDLHLITLVYLAGGPRAVNDWGQELIRQQEEDANLRHIEHEKLPPGIRSFLPGAVSVSGTLWNDEVRVRIEMGGGFYHYGVIVYPRGSVTSAEWWQQLLGWPQEVDIYHE